MVQGMKYVIEKHLQNKFLIIKTSIMNTEKQTLRSSLGIMWTYFHDIIYILVFILFRMLVSGNTTVYGMNNIIYLVTGMIPWFVISDVLSQGTMSIRNNRGIIQSIDLPAVIWPTIDVCSIFMKRLFSFVMLFIIVYVAGYAKYFSSILFVYYIGCLLVLTISMNLLISAFMAISDDFRQLFFAFVRILIYTMPILWDFSRIESTVLRILLKVNPMVYVINGFRDAFVLGPTQSLLHASYFWLCIILMFATGCFVQSKLNKYYADFI